MISEIRNLITAKDRAGTTDGIPRFRSSDLSAVAARL
jgi:hypothetical protein